VSSSVRPGREHPRRLVYRWDLDKTYLESEFESLRGIVKIPFEKAEDKVAAPGVATLMRALREAALRNGWAVGVYFVSASPPQIGREIKKKLELDGIVYDGIAFKDQLRRIVRGKFRQLREQVGFKLTELLKERIEEPAIATEYLFGDDWESDPLIYSLYADVVASRLAPDDLTEVLTTIGVDPPLIERARVLASEVTPSEAVTRIFINLERRTPPASFRSFGSRLVPTFNYFQTAAVLFDDGVLDADGVVGVARVLADNFAYRASHLANSLADVARRGHIHAAAVALLRDHLHGAGLVPMRHAVWNAPLRKWWNRFRVRVGRSRQRTREQHGWIDYRALVAARDGVEGSQK